MLLKTVGIAALLAAASLAQNEENSDQVEAPGNSGEGDEEMNNENEEDPEEDPEENEEGDNGDDSQEVDEEGDDAQEVDKEEGDDAQEVDEEEGEKEELEMITNFYSASTADVFDATLRLEAYHCDDPDAAMDALEAIDDPVGVTDEDIENALSGLEGCPVDEIKGRTYVDENGETKAARVAYLEIASILTEARGLCQDEESANEAAHHAWRLLAEGYQWPEGMEFNEINAVDFTAIMNAVERTEGCQLMGPEICEQKCPDKKDDCIAVYEEAKAAVEGKDENVVLSADVLTAAGCPAYFDGTIADLEQAFAEEEETYKETVELAMSSAESDSGDNNDEGDGSGNSGAESIALNSVALIGAVLVASFTL